MSHDQLFKDLLQAFFREFLELFFPAVAARLDFSEVSFGLQEVFTDIPEGEKRVADLVAQVKTLEGVPELVLIHIEVEAQHRGTFPARMAEYYMLLRLRRRLPVMPIVVYLSPGAGGLVQEVYTEAIFDRSVLRFTYDAIGLPDLEAEEYVARDNPLAPALSALMRPRRAGRLAQKLRAIKQVLRSAVDEARRSLLINVVEQYVYLSSAERAEYERQLREEPEVREMLNIYEERAMERGMERGIVRGKRGTVLRQLQRKFGELPPSVVARIEQIEDPDELDLLLDRLMEAGTLAEIGL